MDTSILDKKTIRILGRKYALKHMSRDKLLKLHGTPVHGLHDAERRLIYVETDSSESFRLSVLRHECVHAALAVTGLDQVIPPEFQEILCETFASLMEDLV